MFTIRFPTADYRPDLAITIRNNVDGWTEDIPGEYKDDEWRFMLDEDRYPVGLVFKFILERTYWMIGPNLFPPAPCGRRLSIHRRPGALPADHRAGGRERLCANVVLQAQLR